VADAGREEGSGVDCWHHT